MTTERDLRNQMAYAREEAIQEGRKKGHAEGMAQGKIETIRKMLAGGIPAEAIAEALGMSVEECESYPQAISNCLGLSDFSESY